MSSFDEKLKAPFPYFGAKYQVAHIVWKALGQPKHYIEPFFGSGAVLLARPDYDPMNHVETVVDKDCMIANVWRSLQKDPDEVAKWCDWPVNHVDLAARRLKLIQAKDNLAQKLIEDDSYCDPKLAGYWIWAASCWIGTGMTSIGQKPHISKGGAGVHKLGVRDDFSKMGKRPHISWGGMGVHKLNLRDDSSDRIGQIPHLGNSGKGVHKISIRDDSSDSTPGVQDPYNKNIYAWFRKLSERLRYVRVVCGDWTRVCSGNWQDLLGTVGIFFDPPYSHYVGRCEEIYDEESADVSTAVRKWALERGERPTYRIVIAGYEGEHDELEKYGWRVVTWKAQGGYGNMGKAKGNENRKRERLWLSPHCLWEERSLIQLNIFNDPAQ